MSVAFAPARTVDVLVVDDDEAARLSLAEALRTFGYPCRTAASAQEAIAEHARQPAALVLTDWSMPGMTGLELCVWLKGQERPPHVILMTAFEGRARLIEGMRAGADDFLRKPIDLDELEVRLVAAARLIDSQRALARANQQLRREGEREAQAARTDPLTGIANRLRLDEDLSRAVDAATRYGRPFSAALCDVDLFKQFNDRYGHLAGDRALQQIAELLRDRVRGGDTVYRFGGEEFVVLLPEQTGPEAERAMERIRAAVESLAIPHGGSPRGVVTMSVGVAELAGSPAAEWLARADAALYEAKSRGRNRVVSA